jgi:hypothetical protein
MERPILLVPLMVTEPLTVDRVLLQWGDQPGIPVAMGYGGTTASGEPALLIASETRIEEWALSYLSRTVVEQSTFAKFAADEERISGRRSWGMPTPGGNPPDLVVSRDGREVALELTQLALPDRRRSIARLGLVEAAIDRIENSSPALAGWQVLLAADDLGVPDFLDGHAEEIATIISALRPEEHLVTTPDGQGLPAAIELPTPVLTSRHYQIMGVPPSLSRLSSRFAARHGFELGLAHSTTLRRDQLLEQLRRTILDKDRVENEELLITIGGPDQTGYRWPGEGFIYDLFTLGELPKMASQYLRRVYLHNWLPGNIAEVPLETSGA